jgi:pyridoxamine 5'-phosphate oxidase
MDPVAGVRDPIAVFLDWLERAKAAEAADATAAALATADASGRPSVRMVLLKSVDDCGFVFFTNHGSRKARDLEANPQAALCFHWPTLGAQFRVEGRVVRVSPEEADAYFATRPRESQLAAWASRQSAPIAHRDVLMACYAEMARRFAGGAVPRPYFWGGYRVGADRLELWRADERRLNRRVCWQRFEGGWREEALQP